MLSTGPSMVVVPRRSRPAHRFRPIAPSTAIAVVLAAALFGGTAEPARAQNLVPNGSFESNTGIPTGYSQLNLALPWLPPTITTPDYFHFLAPLSTGVGVAANDFGNQAALTGRAYAGFHARPVNFYREYVESPLAAPLQAGQTYNVSFAVSLCDRCSWAVDRIGAYLSNGPVGPLNVAYTLPFVPQVNHPFGSPITDKTGWTPVAGQFTAVGGEDSIVIGNFYDDPTTMLLTGQGGPYQFAYYYVDDVSVTLALPPCVTPPTGMVAWYPLDEPAGATAVADIAPPPGSLVNNVGLSQPGPLGPPGPGNGPVPVVGQVAGAHYFYPNHFHEVASHPELDFGTGDFSIDAWIRAVGNGGLDVQSIVDKLDIPLGNVGFALYVHDRYLKLNLSGSTFSAANQITGGNPMANTGPWYHVAATVDRGAGVGTLYIDGAPDATFVPPPQSVTNAVPLWIGETRLPQSVGEIAVDELELFDRALTAQEVMDLFSAGPSGKCKAVTADLGDAPDSSNHIGTTMSTYATGNFPTVYDPPSPGPAGPLHRDAKGLLWLGADVSFEAEADIGADQDPTNNLVATGSPPTADHDLFDDGVAVGSVPLPNCALTQFSFSATNAAATTTTGYVNVWFDWTRDGDWDDIPRCAVAPNVDAVAAEWAVQNQAVSLAAGFNAALATSPFRALNPLPGQPTWMRITLTDAPIVAASHGGPFPLPADLGRGGSGPAGGYPFGETEDYLLDGPSGRAELCVLKFNDADGDGVQDPGEVGLPGWSFDVLDAGGNVVTTLTTGPGGTFCVGIPAPAPYTVVEVPQPLWVQTFPGPPGTHSVAAAPGQLINLVFGNKRKTGRIYLPFAVRAYPGIARPTSVATAAPTVEPTIPGVATQGPTAVGGTGTVTPTPPGPSPSATRPTPATTPSDTPTTTQSPPGATSSATPTREPGDPSPTPTPSSSATSSATPTASATATGGRITPTVTPTSTPTATATPTLPVRPTALPSPTPGCAQRPPDMNAWWPLDELAGIVAGDIAGANHGSMAGGAAVVNPAKVAAGRQFDGTTGHVVVPDAAALDPGSGDFSVDAWIRPRAVDARRPIASKMYAPADAPLGWLFSLEGGQLSLTLSNEGSSITGTAPSAMTVDGQWHLVAATVQRGSATGGRLYLDGALIHTFDTTPLGGPIDTAAELWIAGVNALGRGLPARFFDGGIDEVEVFGRALTAGEVGAIYGAGAYGKCGKPAGVIRR